MGGGGGEGGGWRLGVQGVAGCSAGLVATALLHPLDLVKIRIQVRSASEKFNVYKGTFLGLRTVVEKEGCWALYRGVTPNLIGNGLAWGSYFVNYDFIKRKMRTDPKVPLTPAEHMAAGTIAGAGTLLLTNPIWLVKTRMCLTVGPTQAVSSEYRGVFSSLAHIVRNEGFLSLYKGFLPGLFGTLHGGVQFMVYEEAKRQMNRYKGRPDNFKLDVLEYLVMAAVSKSIAGAVTYPYQVLRSWQQMERSSLSTVEAIKILWKKDGIKAYFRGLPAYIIRVLPATCVTFVTYETLVDFLQKRYLE